MAQFLTTHGTAFHIENIIQEAKQKLFLVSPYLQISKILYERLIDADKRGVSINIVYGKDELKIKEKEQLSSLANLKLFFCENLHAKCYYNEDFMIISSMNMYEFSEKNNKEMGVLISRVNDEGVFKAAENEVNSIVRIAKEVYYSNHSKENNYNTIEKKNINVKNNFRKGFCIRCGCSIPYNTTSPYCYSCYGVWSMYNNIDYQENHCHSCGRQNNEATMMKPECWDCYKENGF